MGKVSGRGSGLWWDGRVMREDGCVCGEWGCMSRVEVECYGILWCRVDQ